MTAPRHLSLVLRREVTERLRSRSFQATTLFLLVVTAVGELLFGHSVTATRTHRLAVVGAMPAGLAEATAQMATEMQRTRIELSTVPDVAAARAQLRAGRLDAVAVDPTHLIVNTSVDDGYLVFRALRRAELAQHLRAAGLSDTEVARLVAQAHVRRLDGAGVAPAEAQSLAPTPPTAHVDLTILRPLNIGSGVAAIGAIAVVFYLFVYGNWIAQGVAEETSGGVSNIMMATCPPTRFLVGKTLGIGIVALVQATVLSLPTLALLVTRASGVPLTASMVLTTVMWFVLAFAIYGQLYAAVGARARKVEKVMGTTVWVALPMVILALVGALAVVYNPDGGLTAFLSFLPLSAPFTMPARAAAQHLGWWEVPTAAAGSALSAAVAAWVGTRLYVRGLGRA